MLSIRRIALVVLAGLLLPCLSLTAGEPVTEINGLKVVASDGIVKLEISKTGEVEFRAFTMAEPDRLVVDCIGAKYDIPGIDGSTQSTFIDRVRTSQYQVDPVMITRIVIDLKQKVDYRMYENGDTHVVELGTGIKTASNETATGQEKVVPVVNVVKEEKPAAAPPQKIAGASMGPALPMMAASGEKAKQVDKEKKAPAEDESSPWLTDDNSTRLTGSVAADVNTAAGTSEKATGDMRWSESYVRGAPAAGGGVAMGARKITLDAQGADIKTVLRTISDFAGVNIVSGKGVEGEVHVHIKDCPWQEALDIILKANGYGYREEFGMIRVADLSTLLREELEVQTAEKKKEELLPLKTRIIFVNNSNAEELRAALENMLTSTRASIDVDASSNSLIVRDIEQNVEKISEMVKDLDKRTFQVDINAKLVEVDVEASRELGIDWSMLNLNSSEFDGTGSIEVTEKITNPSGTVKFGTVRSWGELTAMLQMLEKTNKANIISNPRITTMDNREASILVGKEIPLIVADEAGNPVTELTKIGIMLRVIPHVNADRTITLDLHPEVSELQSESTAQGGVIITTAEADTRVIVADGETAVIGGLIKKADTELVRGIPVLKDIPFLGRLFSSKASTNKKTELVIFVTPTIVE